MTLCSTLSQFVCTADAPTLVAYLEGDAPDEAQGCAVMRSLLAYRPQVAHDVLCRFYDVSYYKVGDSCFRDEAPESEHEMWFVATAPDAFESVESVPLARSEEEARAFAVQHLKLDALFLGEQTAPCAALVD